MPFKVSEKLRIVKTYYGMVGEIFGLRGWDNTPLSTNMLFVEALAYATAAAIEEALKSVDENTKEKPVGFGLRALRFRGQTLRARPRRF